MLRDYEIAQNVMVIMVVLIRLVHKSCIEIFFSFY